ncbi:MAG: (2Fe-2S)-binding protein [Deltaproteobacteria bacterium]|nr:(2Fe-2S)-binding protein [Deltaproteobacteria bacterium]
MNDTIEIKVRVNGIDEAARLQANTTLLTFLRESLNLTGAKEGCNEGECGSCMVLLDGKAVNSCLILAAEVDGREIVTIEGIGNAKSLHPLQRSFLKHHAVQCGFCMPGMIITALGLIGEKADPSEGEIKTALAGNLCRCTGYEQIIQSIQAAAKQLRAQEQKASRRTA